jgi:hypothetical protein
VPIGNPPGHFTLLILAIVLGVDRNGGPLPIAGVSLIEALAPAVVTCKQKCGMVVTKRDHMGAPSDEFLPESLMELRKVGPMDAGILIMFEMKTDIEHCQIKEG